MAYPLEPLNDFLVITNIILYGKYFPCTQEEHVLCTPNLHCHYGQYCTFCDFLFIGYFNLHQMYFSRIIFLTFFQYNWIESSKIDKVCDISVIYLFK